MKAELITKKFKPVTIHVTFETERELKFAKEFFGNLSGYDSMNIANNNGDNDFTGDDGAVLNDTMYKIVSEALA